MNTIDIQTFRLQTLSGTEKHFVIFIRFVKLIQFITARVQTATAVQDMVTTNGQTLTRRSENDKPTSPTVHHSSATMDGHQRSGSTFVVVQRSFRRQPSSSAGNVVPDLFRIVAGALRAGRGLSDDNRCGSCLLTADWRW